MSDLYKIELKMKSKEFLIGLIKILDEELEEVKVENFSLKNQAKIDIKK